MNDNQGQQFTCEECGKPKYAAEGSSHFHIPISQEDRDFYKGLREHFDMLHQMDSVERTREVNLNDKADLLDHLKSNNGHMMGEYAGYRGTYYQRPYHDIPDRIPGVRDYDGEDHELSHEELKAVHTQLHNLYPDEAHVTEGSYHRHL